MGSSVTLSYTGGFNFRRLQAARLFSLLVMIGIWGWNVGAWAAEYERTVEKDFSLKSVGQLRVVNPQGNISVQGWALDKIRLKVTQVVSVSSEAEAETVFKKLSYRYEVVGPDIEIHSQYGTELNLSERMQLAEKGNQKVHYSVMAPSYFRLKAWTTSGRISVKNWNKDVEVRSNSGPIGVENLRADRLLGQCLTCSMELKNIASEIRAVSHSGLVHLLQVQGPSVFAESEEGSVSVEVATGSQSYQTKSGGIKGQGLKGDVVASSQSGGISLHQKGGTLSVSTDSGAIDIGFLETRFDEKSSVASKSGQIRLEFPSHFGAEADLQTKTGDLQCDLPFQSFLKTDSVQGESKQRRYGRIGSGGPFLSVTSENGSIQVRAAGTLVSK